MARADTRQARRRRRPRSTVRLGGEPLEPRSMLALSAGLGAALGPIVPEPPSPPTLAPPPGISLEAGVIRIVGDDRADKAIVAVKTVGHSQQVFVTLDQATFKQVALGSPPAKIIKHSEKTFPLSSVSAVYFSGGDGDDSFLNQSSLPSLADGGRGNDSLTGGAGKDSLAGGAGFDWLEGRGGDDKLTGGGDGDRYLFKPGAALGVDTIEEDPNRDADRLDFSSFALGITVSLRETAQQTVRPGVLAIKLSTATGIEDVDGGSGNDDITGNDRYNRLYGWKGNDVVSDLAAAVAGGGAEIFGGDGDDILRGSAVADSISGGAGTDDISGNGGDDTIHCGAGNDVKVSGGDGNDTIYGEDGNDIINGDGGIDHIEGGAGDDQISGSLLWGGLGNDKLFGGPSDDIMQGGPGDDALYGYLGDDKLWGEEGNDLLRGDTGADLLDGGPGLDSLYGGEGIDTLKGGPGSDRFLQQWHVGTGFEDTIVDGDGRDTAPVFQDGDGSTSGLGWSWSGQTWKAAEIADADVALGELHRRTGNPALLQHWNGFLWADDVFIRAATPMSQIDGKSPRPSDGVLAFNTGAYMVFPNSAFSPASFNLKLQVVQHELGHNFDHSSVMGALFGDLSIANASATYGQFLGLSTWQPLSKELTPPKGFIRGGEDNVKSPTDWVYSAKAVFASGYGRQTPNEDFATCFESAMANWAGRTWEVDSGRTATAVPAKWAFVNNLIAKAAARPFAGA